MATIRTAVDSHANDADHITPPRPAATGTARTSMARLRAGLGVAALAGVIAAGGVATSLGSPINAAASPNDTTCCGISLSRMA